MERMAIEAVFVRSTNVVTRKIDGETLIVPVRSDVGDLGSIFSLNEVGTFIWEALAQPATVENVVRGIVENYETTPAKAEQDVDCFLTEMQTADLVEIVPGMSVLSLQAPVSLEART
jgi:coenzyme PQQ synthesis protein D (PqqD)